MDEQGALGKTQAGSIGKVEAGTGDVGGMQIHCHSMQNWGWESQSTSGLSLSQLDH